MVVTWQPRVLERLGLRNRSRLQVMTRANPSELNVEALRPTLYVRNAKPMTGDMIRKRSLKNARVCRVCC